MTTSVKSVPYIHDEIIHNSSAASEVLPIVFDIFRPSSVLDIGCGLGNWLEVSKRLGVNEIIGVDGTYVNRKLLKIAPEEFVESDLQKGISLGRRFDLGICLEVAEHLPESSAETLVRSLTYHADVLLFSAAIPGQGGQFHLNEQWPAYWQNLFFRNDFVFVDCLRNKIWMNEKVEWWYRQNIFLVVKKDHALANQASGSVLPLVHPELFKNISYNAISKIQRLEKNIAHLQKRDIVGKFSKLLKRKK